MALLPRLPRRPPPIRLFQTGDPEPTDRPNLISLSKVRFHWDAEQEDWYRCDSPDGPRFPWIYLIESFVLVAADTSGCTHSAPGGERR